MKIKIIVNDTLLVYPYVVSLESDESTPSRIISSPVESENSASLGDDPSTTSYKEYEQEQRGITHKVELEIFSNKVELEIYSEPLEEVAKEIRCVD
jgi:hypothetical protein